MKITYGAKPENIDLNNMALKKVLPHTVHFEHLTEYVSNDLPTPELPFSKTYRKSIWLKNSGGSYVEFKAPHFYPNAIVFGHAVIPDTNNETEMLIHPETILDVTIPEAVLRKMKEVISQVTSVHIYRTFSMLHIQLDSVRESWLYSSAKNFGTLLGDFDDVYLDDDLKVLYNACRLQGTRCAWDVEPNKWVETEIYGSVVNVYRESANRKG